MQLRKDDGGLCLKVEPPDDYLCFLFLAVLILYLY